MTADSQKDLSKTSSLMFLHWEYFEILSKQKGFVITFTLSALLSALALTYVYSEKYEAATAIFYRPQEITRLKANQPQAFGSPVPAPPFKVIGKTIEELLHSEIILRNVVTKLKLDVPEEKIYEGPWYVRYYEMTKDYVKEYGQDLWTYLKFGRLTESLPDIEAIKKLRKHVKVESEDSYVFYLIVRDKRPRRAANIVDELATELVAWLREQDRQPSSLRRVQLEKLLVNKGEEIVSYQAEIERLLSSNGIASISHEIDRSMERLSTLEVDRIQLQSSIEQQETKLESLRNKLAMKQTDRASQFQPEDFKRLTSEEIFTQIELSGLQSQYKSLRKEISTLKKRLQNLPNLQLRIQRLEALLNTANRDYTLQNDALQEVIVRESNVLSEIGILHHANVPTSPKTPIKVYHASLAGGLGLLLSIGLVYLLSYFNIRILLASEGPKRRSTTPADKDDK
jgi:uncharacterized protein involved in exopolysaccharide biosynthesis